MANYRDLTTRPGIEYVGGTQTRNVQIGSFFTVPHDVYMETRVAQADYTAAVMKQNANGFGIVIEQLFAVPGVEGIEWTQVPTAGTQLADHLLISVSSSSGLSSGIVDEPFSALTLANVKKKVAALQAELDATEAP